MLNSVYTLDYASFKNVPCVIWLRKRKNEAKEMGNQHSTNCLTITHETCLASYLKRKTDMTLLEIWPMHKKSMTTTRYSLWDLYPFLVARQSIKALRTQAEINVRTIKVKDHSFQTPRNGD